MKRVLFICSQNKLRSPTAEQVFSCYANLEVSSAGTNNDAENPLTAELLKWADIMERAHRTKVQQRFRSALNSKQLICLNIPDNYEFMQPDLVDLLEAKVSRYLLLRSKN